MLPHVEILADPVLLEDGAEIGDVDAGHTRLADQAVRNAVRVVSVIASRYINDQLLFELAHGICVALHLYTR